ncbi:hypothetical protein HQ38_07440 [Porphyromonas crevioricanis]|uniref:Uncharacterized protein n=1 Tax=Porphyromonas crevioricanis TaxID=393921 RepID=A0AB34PF48_9PORP|nr:hypothetical protein HQ38_07440 [Porphyromonas crevioricanis]
MAVFLLLSLNSFLRLSVWFKCRKMRAIISFQRAIQAFKNLCHRLIFFIFATIIAMRLKYYQTTYL